VSVPYLFAIQGRQVRIGATSAEGADGAEPP